MERNIFKLTYRFLRCAEDGGVRIIFLDYGRTLASFQSVLISSVGISLAGLMAVLLDNALKYSPEGSAILLRLERRGKGVSLQVENESTQILRREHMERMFNRFYRGDSSRSSRTSGYGIGLSIAKAVVGAHRGKIGASSPDGRRLVISAVLPG